MKHIREAIVGFWQRRLSDAEVIAVSKRYTAERESVDQIQIEYVPLKKLHPWAMNPRDIKDENYEALKRGVETFGLVAPIVARREDGRIIGGHQRYLVGQDLDEPTLPVVFLDGLDDEACAALNILLNNPETQGEWEMSKLTNILSELDAGGFDATITGFSEKDLEKMVTWENPDNKKGGGKKEPVNTVVYCADCVYELVKACPEHGE